MNENRINEMLDSALSHAAPDDLENVFLRAEKEKEKGSEIEVTETKTKKKFGKWQIWQRVLVAACLVLVVIGGVGGILLGQANAVVSVVSLDVNPGIELSINRGEKVISCRAVNADAEKLLSDMGGGRDLEGVKLDVAVNALVGALVRAGYLNDISSAILVSVEDDDETRAARIQQELVDYIDGALKGESGQASVFSHSTTRSEVEAIARDNNISTGKATLINEIIKNNGITDEDAFEKLSLLTVKELVELKRTGDSRIPIGSELAASAAIEYAGAAGKGVLTDVDPELDDVPPCYEVEIITDNGKYEYTVDAYTGEVLTGARDIFASAPKEKLTEDEALAAAKAHMTARFPELSGSTPEGVVIRTDDKDGEYEIEFVCGGYKFEYDIDIYTASVLDWDVEKINAGGNGSAQSPSETTASPSSPAPAPSADIGEEAAKAAAFSHAGVKEADVTLLRVVRDYDDGRLEYDVEFRVGNIEYEYEIDGETGAVISYDRETVGQAGTTTPPATKPETEPPTTTKPETQPPTTTKPTVSDIGSESAKAAAFAHAGVGENEVSNLKVERDYDDGILEYEVEFRVGNAKYEYKINGSTGAVISYEVEGDHDDDHDHNSAGGNASADIGAEKAKAAAFSHAGVSEADVRALKVEREEEHGRIEYEIEFRVGAYEYEYTIDGATGKVLSHEKDHDD